MRPAQPRQIVDQRLGKIAVLGVLHDAHRTVALGEALAVHPEDHRDVREFGKLRSERVKNVDLARRVVDVIVAADDVRDLHVEVVHDDTEVVGGDPVGAQQHQIVELRVRHRYRPFDEIVKADFALLRVAEAHDRRPVGRGHEPCGLGALGAPAPVVAGLLAARALAFAHHVELFPGRPAAVGFSLRDELLGDFLVARNALQLEERSLVPIEPEPAHAVEDRLHRGLGGALKVGVLDAQNKLAAVLARVGPGEQRGTHAAYVEITGGAWGKTGSDHGGGWETRILREASREPGGAASLLEFALAGG